MRRVLLAALAAVFVAAAVMTLAWKPPWFQAVRVVPEIRAVLLDPYEHPLLGDYKAYRDALLAQDVAALEALAQSGDTYPAYRAALALAEQRDLDAAFRTAYYRRALGLRVEDPLDRLDRRAVYLAYAQTAEAAGLLADALRGYREALPAAEAVAGLSRVETDPYRLANTFLRARRFRDALAALDGRAAPSIEAPAYRALGEHQAARSAYERWLEEVPDSFDARLGLAWSHYYLGNLEEAETRFAALPGASATYGRALVARRQGDTSRAVALLRQTGDPADLWLATGYLEGESRYRESLPLYLDLARGDSGYADDAAYRAHVLALRLNDAETAAEALELIPTNSFFGLKLGKPLELPPERSAPRAELPVLAVAGELARVGDMDAAVGELLFALRHAQDANERLTLAERLQILGEFRQGQRVASDLLGSGLDDRRVWRVAYPQAFALPVGEEASRHGLEPALVWAIMRQESAFFPKAISSSNAQGLMQVIPSTWDWLAELQREAPGNPFDIATNVRYGSFYLRWLTNYLQGDLELVIASYNRGQGYIRRLFEGEVVNFDKDDLYREIDALETREYLQRVMVNYEVYKALYPTLSEQP